MTRDGKILDLDELFGQARPIAVTWEGRRYELRRPDALTPQEYVRWQRLNGKIATLQAMEGDLTDQQAQELTELVGTIMRLLNTELGEQDLSFTAKIRVLQFFTQSLREEEQASKAEPENP